MKCYSVMYYNFFYDFNAFMEQFKINLKWHILKCFFLTQIEFWKLQKPNFFYVCRSWITNSWSWNNSLASQIKTEFIIATTSLASYDTDKMRGTWWCHHTIAMITYLFPGIWCKYVSCDFCMMMFFHTLLPPNPLPSPALLSLMVIVFSDHRKYSMYGLSLICSLTQFGHLDCWISTCPLVTFFSTPIGCISSIAFTLLTSWLGCSFWCLIAIISWVTWMSPKIIVCINETCLRMKKRGSVAYSSWKAYQI